MALLEIKNLKTYFKTDEGLVKAVDDISYSVNKGKILAVVGESGCGKSVTALSIMKLVQSPPGCYEGGEILFDGKDILTLSDKELRNIRGNQIAMIFQDPMTALNPVFTCGSQVAEAVMLHQNLNNQNALKIVEKMFIDVGLPSPKQRMNEYPHQLSGGMCQRVMIAMALACKPKLLIADEPTTALDVTIQAQILDLINGLKDEYQMSVVFITHDLGVVAEIADDVVVMYAGKIVEKGSVQEIFDSPLHPYTQGLLKSVRSLVNKDEKLYVIKGSVPDPRDFPSGCAFHPRCLDADSECSKVVPKFKTRTACLKVAE